MVKSDLSRVSRTPELALQPPHPNTPFSCLARCVQRDYRSRIATVRWKRASATGSVALVMYNLTNLHFQITDEDRLRKVGMSKERRVDPQIAVRLLVTAARLPLEIAIAEDNKTETKMLISVIPVIEQSGWW